MDLAREKLHFIAILSSAKDSRERAKALISLADCNRRNARTLAACATVLLSASLEQAVKTVLSEADEKAAVDSDVHVPEREPRSVAASKVIANRSEPRQVSTCS